MPSLDLAAALHSERHAAGGPDPITPASIGAAPAAHADSHATGGSDPITPESIGAYPATNPTYTGHVNDLREPGAYRISSGSMNAGNGYPWTPDMTGYLIVHAYSSAYVTQEVVSELGTVWRRNSVAGSSTAWRSWTPIAVDTGWRDISYSFYAGWLGEVHATWRNGIVEIRGREITHDGAPNANVLNVPPPFRPGRIGGSHAGGAWGAGSSSGTASGAAFVSMTGGSFNELLRAHGSGWSGGEFSLSFTTDYVPSDPLPGTPA